MQAGAHAFSSKTTLYGTLFKEETGKELVLDNYIIGRIKCSINPFALSFSGALALKYKFIKFMTPSHFDAKG